MSVLTVFFLGWRNFSRNLLRYKVLIVALLVVVCVFTVIIGTLFGMTQAIQSKAARYFSGQITLQQIFVNSFPRIVDASLLLDKLQYSASLPGIPTLRSVYYDAGKAELFFGGYSQRQRRLIGVDWQLEDAVLSELDFVAGSVPTATDSLAILVSTTTAEALKLALGDELVVRLPIESGALNSAVFIVKGIFHESSFFAYSSYLDRTALNRLMAVNDDAVNEIGFFLNPSTDIKVVAAHIHTLVSTMGPTLPLLTTRSQRDSIIDSDLWSDGDFLVMTLDAQLAEIYNLLRALWVIGLVLVGLFALLVVIGVSNTYSFLVLERTAEIGTVRAIGMSKAKVVVLFLSESFALGLTGLLIGLGLGLIVLEGIRLGIDLSGSDLASLFLVRGRLAWKLAPVHVLIISILSVVSIVTGSLGAAWKGAQMRPVDALRSA